MDASGKVGAERRAANGKQVPSLLSCLSVGRTSFAVFASDAAFQLTAAGVAAVPVLLVSNLLLPCWQVKHAVKAGWQLQVQPLTACLSLDYQKAVRAHDWGLWTARQRCRMVFAGFSFERAAMWLRSCSRSPHMLFSGHKRWVVTLVLVLYVGAYPIAAVENGRCGCVYTSKPEVGQRQCRWCHDMIVTVFMCMAHPAVVIYVHQLHGSAFYVTWLWIITP